MDRIEIQDTNLPEVQLLTPKVYKDYRGFFLESYNNRTYADLPLIPVGGFKQDNHSRSEPGILRGIHYQIRYPQGKLIRCITGKIFDVAIDLRKSSMRFGQCAFAYLSEDNFKILWIPPGFGHAFFVVGDKSAHVLYKATEYWYPDNERCIIWNDSDLDIKWPLDRDKYPFYPIVSDKDKQGKFLKDAEVYE